MYLAGDSPRIIGRSFGVPASRVYPKLRERGVGGARAAGAVPVSALIGILVRQAPTPAVSLAAWGATGIVAGLLIRSAMAAKEHPP